MVNVPSRKDGSISDRSARTHDIGTGIAFVITIAFDTIRRPIFILISNYICYGTILIYKS